MLICAVTGPDGSGKSTACQTAAQLLEAQWGSGTALPVSIWDSVQNMSGEAALASRQVLNKETAIQYLSDLDGYTRTLYLYHALSRSMDLAIRKKPRCILVEGYWFKYAVSEIGYGVHQETVLAGALGFPRPHLTFCLDLSPEEALKRKAAASAYEQGNTADLKSGKNQKFVEFQQRLLPVWQEVERRTCLSNPANPVNPATLWTHLSAKETPQSIAQSITRGILAEVGKW